jgi:type II secretion system protein J
MLKKNLQKNKGFTLIEMLVAVGLFSVVVTVAMGTIFTIIDTNRKSQTLTLVMNNLNFSLESMTRTLKTAIPASVYDRADTEVCALNPIQQNFINENYNDEICYEFIPGADGSRGYITRSNSNGSNPVRVTSDSVDIKSFKAKVIDPGSNGQPRVFITVSGVAQISPRVSSEFDIQTTVTPRTLDIKNP